MSVQLLNTLKAQLAACHVRLEALERERADWRSTAYNRYNEIEQLRGLSYNEAGEPWIAVAAMLQAENVKLREALAQQQEESATLTRALLWIADIAAKEHGDPKLRADGARTLRRIITKVEETIRINKEEKILEQK